jgi:hypothetical protein
MWYLYLCGVLCLSVLLCLPHPPLLVTRGVLPDPLPDRGAFLARGASPDLGALPGPLSDHGALSGRKVLPIRGVLSDSLPNCGALVRC